MHLPLLCPTLPGWWWVGLAMFDPIAACPLEGAFALMGNCYCTFAHLCGPARRQLGQIPKYAPPPTNLGGWENSDSCI